MNQKTGQGQKPREPNEDLWSDWRDTPGDMEDFIFAGQEQSYPSER